MSLATPAPSSSSVFFLLAVLILFYNQNSVACFAILNRLYLFVGLGSLPMLKFFQCSLSADMFFLIFLK
jgi:hypothetical protein